MTKALTEQWREGTLPEDCYYILTKNGHIKKDRTCFYSHTDEQCFCFIPNKDIEEVLAPVPSYDEYKELTQRVGRLELDNEVLEDVVQECNKRGLENKRLQEQLNEANRVIKKYAKGKFKCEVIYPDGSKPSVKLSYALNDKPAKTYIKKWKV